MSHAFMFGQKVADALSKQLYPGLPTGAQQDPFGRPQRSLFSPNTPAETFRGTKVEADLPPRTTPRAAGVNTPAIDTDTFPNVLARQQIGQRKPAPAPVGQPRSVIRK